MSGGVPGQVVVHDGSEPLLKVDPLRQAVGGDQHPQPVVGGQFVDAGFALVREMASRLPDLHVRATFARGTPAHHPLRA